jgi:photosystem II stability/assembly factor-like uncharacterized protein
MPEILSAQGTVFYQDEEFSPFDILTCTAVGDVTIPFGDVTARYCPDPNAVGRFVKTGTIRGEADFITFALRRPLYDTLNYLLTELGDCQFHIQVPWANEGAEPSTANLNFLTKLHLHFATVSQKTITAPVVIEPGDNARADTNADMNVLDWRMVYPNTSTRISITEFEDLNDIVFGLSAECNTDEIGGDKIAMEGYITTDFTATSPAVSADVWRTEDYGVTWAACAAQPFAGSESIGAVVMLGDRVIVARSTTDGANPAEVGISDDDGASWSNVNVGSVNGQTVNAMWWEDYTHLWAACSGGYVYFSDDAGDTWTAQTSGTVTAQALQDIVAFDRSTVWAVGAAGAIIRTTDGSNWAAVTGPAAVADQFNTVFVRTPNLVLIGSDAGNVYRTDDAGVSWGAALTTPQWSGGEVMRIRGEQALNYFLDIIGNTSGGAGECYRSHDGGATFQEVSLDTNLGLNGLFVVDQNTAWVCGAPQGGTGFLAKIHETS